MKIQLSSILLLTGIFITSLSCSKQPAIADTATTVEHKIQVNAIASNGAVINYTHIGISLQNGEPVKHTKTGLNVTTWSSDVLTAPKGTTGVLVLADGAKTSNTSSIKLQLLVDGKVTREARSVTSGNGLRAQINYLFNE